MSSSEPGDRNSVLYLQQIDIKTTTRRNIRIKLQLDGKNFEVRQGEQPSTWIPSRSLEITDASKITVAIKAGHTMAGVSIRKQEALAEVNVEDAMKAFWNSEDTISDSITFDQQPVVVTLILYPSPSSKTTRAAVQELQKEMNAYRPLMSGATERTGDFIFKHGAALAEMNPIVKMAFSVAKGVFEVLKEQKKRDEAVSDLADCVGRILPYAELVIEDIICEETDLLERVVTKLCALIRDTASFVCGYAKQSPAMRAMKSTTSTESSTQIKTLTDDFSKLEREFDRAVDVTALKMAKKNEEFRLLDRLRPTHTAGYQEGRSCMEGTRTGVLEDLISWALNPSSRENLPNGWHAANMYWLYGSPGLGKTSIANSLCDRLHGSKNLGGSFFCRRDDPILREPRRVLPTLISKLTGMWGPYRKLVAQALQDDPQLNPESKRGEALLSLAQSVEKCPPRTFVLVIDALDECGDPIERNSFLKCLLEACSPVSWIKIIITSRPEHDIKTFFDQNHVASRDLANDDQNQDDIWLFTKERMASIASSRYLPIDWPGEERLKQIVNRSGGLFIFVETFCRFMDDHNPKALLAKALDGKFGEANAELHKLYSMAIVSTTGKSMDEFRSLAQAIVVVAIYRPLPDETLASLMGLEPGVVRSLVDGLSPILYRDGLANGGIRVRHLSVIEFLTGPACPEEFRVVLPDANERLGLRCLATMIKELRFNICELKSSCLSNAEIQDLDDRVGQKISDALQYSCMHWTSHLCATSDIASMEVCALLDSFFMGERPLHWMEVLSLIGKIPAGISALRQIKGSIKKFQLRHQDHAADALRFLLAFSTPISTSTPHIYVSALPFSPMGSSLWESASRASPKIMKVYKGRLSSWPAPSGAWLGHKERIWSVAYSPDGRYVASGSDDNTLRIWDAESGAAVGEPLSGHTENIYSVAYSPDGRYIVSGSGDRTIRIWDAESGVAVGEPLTGHTGAVCSVAYSPDGQFIASGFYDGSIRIWDVESGATVGEPLTGHNGSIGSIAYSPDGRYIAAGAPIQIWDTESGAAVGEPLGGIGVSSVAYSPDGRHIASGSNEGVIQIWDTESGAAVGEPLSWHTDSVSSISYSPDGRYIASGSYYNTLQIWDAKSGAAMGEPLRGHTNYVNCLAYSPNCRYIVSGSDDNTIRIWNVESGAAVGESLSGHTGDVSSVAYSPDGRHLVSGSSDQTIRIWDGESGAAVGEPLHGHTDEVYSVAYSPDGRYIASGSNDKTIRIWDAESGVAVGEPLRGHTSAVNSVTYSPNGRCVVSSSYDGTIRIWDAKSGAAMGEPLRGHRGPVYSVAYSPDGQHIVSSFYDGTVQIWDAESGVAVGEPLSGHTDRVWSVAYSPDGRYIASGSNDKTIRIWDAESGAALGEPLSGHTGWVQSIAYSPHGRYIASGSYDGTVRIWDAESGVAVGEPLSGHTGAVWSVAYSPDGRHITSGSRDHTVRVWAAGTTPENRESSPYFTRTMNTVSCSPDGRKVMHESNHPPAELTNTTNAAPDNAHPLSAFSCVAIPPERINSKGWVVGPEGLLFWVPEDCRYGLTHVPMMTIGNMRRDRGVRIDFTDFRYGSSWAEIYEKHVGEDNANEVSS